MESERAHLIDTLLNKNCFLINHPITFYDSMRNNYDIYDETGQLIMQSQEKLVKILGVELRGSRQRCLEPFNIKVTNYDGEQIIRVKRYFGGKIHIFDENDELVGRFKAHGLFGSSRSNFNVLDVDGRIIFRVKRKLFGPKMLFVASKDELARLKCVWKGLLKFFIRASDDYILKISDSVTPDNPVRQLILGVVVCMRGISMSPFFT